MRRMSATELVCAAPSQQRLRRSSVAAALRAASAPSQQHHLRRGRDAQNERDRAGLRISVAAATPSQLRRSSAARTMSGRRGKSSPPGKSKFANNGGASPSSPSNLLFSELIFLKSLGHSPDRKKKMVKKSCAWVVTHRIYKCRGRLVDPLF